MENYDFGGWATRNDLLCADGRTIRKNAFKSQDGQIVPLVYNHNHSDASNVLGHAVLENREDGVYAYGVFNDSDSGRAAKEAVKHGDMRSLSIYANNLKQSRDGDVIHGIIREVSLVFAGANPGAFIDTVLAHSDDYVDGLIVGYDENLTLYHSDNNYDDDEVLEHSEEDEDVDMEKEDKSVEDIINSMTEEQQNVLYALIGNMLPDEDEDDDYEEGDDEMKHNLFDNDEQYDDGYLSHSDEMEIMDMAKGGYGTFQNALAAYAEDTWLQHGLADGDIDALFPDYKDVYPGEPETITRDLTWIEKVMNGVHKSPISRVRTRQFDARQTGIRAKGYKKGAKKTEIGNVKLLNRTTDPQTVYVKDKLNRDDIIDFTDFSLVDYTYKNMKMALTEELAIAIMVGDGREDGDENKISEDHIRSIWHDDDLYTIHYDVDIAGTEKELQGSDTAKHFSENYIYAEAIIKAALYSREQYKGSGTLSFYCTPHLLNVMLLARDMNGRRIYESKSDLAAALNVASIETAEQFEGLIREDKQHKKHKLLGIFVNLTDYQVGSTKGGEITSFNDFDIDFNQEKYLMETRVSGALTRVYSAIALEEPVSTTSSDSGVTPGGH